jgi:broad specificity phosphatase PhoE
VSIIDRVRETIEARAVQRRADVAFLRVQESIASQLQQELTEEDIGWRKLTEGAGGYDLTPTELRDVREKCLKAWQIDPSLGTAGALLASGAFGTGEIRPMAVDQRVQAVVDRLWDDEDNRLALFSRRAMVRTSDALMVDGERFLAVHASTTESRVKVSELPCSEIVDVVCHPENALRPVLYRRTYRPQAYDLGKGQYQPGPEQTVYYADWRTWRYMLDETFTDEDPEWDEATAALLSRAGILDDPTPVLCYHIRGNTLGQRGIPEIYRAYDWVRSHSRTLSAMVTLSKALAMFAWRKKLNTKSATAVQAAAEAFRSPVPGTGAVHASNQNVSLEAVDVGTGGVGNLESSARQTHLQSIRPFGFGEHWYSDANTGNLATATAMDLPSIWRIEARQADVSEPCLDITRLAVELAVLRQDYPTRRLPQGVDRAMDMDFPAAQPPNPANTAQLLGALTAASGTLLDPREAAYQAYAAIGSNNIQEILERQFPPQEKLDGEMATTDGPEPQPGQPSPDETPTGEQDAEQVAERAQEAVPPFR